MLLMNKRQGPFHLKPAKEGGKPRIFAAGTTMNVSDEEGAQLVKYKDIVQLKDGAPVAAPASAKPVPAGSGLAGKAVMPEAEPASAKPAKK